MIKLRNDYRFVVIFESLLSKIVIDLHNHRDSNEHMNKTKTKRKREKLAKASFARIS